MRPLFQKVHAARVRQIEKEMLAGFQLRLGARQGGVWRDQIGRRIHGAAHFAVVAILVFGVAVGAFALDEAVGQEHALGRIEELLDGAGFDQAGGLQVFVDGLRQLGVFGAVGAVPVVEADVKTIQILLAASGNVGHKLLGCFAGFLGSNHDGRAVCIVCTDKLHLMSLHALKAHPNVGLDVFHDVADVEGAVGIGKGGGNKELARHGVWNKGRLINGTRPGQPSVFFR